MVWQLPTIFGGTRFRWRVRSAGYVTGRSSAFRKCHAWLAALHNIREVLTALAPLGSLPDPNIIIPPDHVAEADQLIAAIHALHERALDTGNRLSALVVSEADGAGKALALRQHVNEPCAVKGHSFSGAIVAFAPAVLSHLPAAGGRARPLGRSCWGRRLAFVRERLARLVS